MSEVAHAKDTDGAGPGGNLHVVEKGQDQGDRDPNRITLRRMMFKDIDTLVGWIRDDPGILTSMQMPEDTTELQIRSGCLHNISDPAQLWLVAERGGDEIGIVAATGIDQQQRICTPHILVSPHHRFGRTYWRLQRAALNLADELGFQQLVAFVPADNEVAIRANERQGFVKRDVVMMVRERGAS